MTAEEFLPFKAILDAEGFDVIEELKKVNEQLALVVENEMERMLVGDGPYGAENCGVAVVVDALFGEFRVGASKLVPWGQVGYFRMNDGSGDA